MFAGWIRGDSGSSEAEGDPDNNIPMDCAQYFIAGTILLFKKIVILFELFWK